MSYKSVNTALWLDNHDAIATAAAAAAACAQVQEHHAESPNSSTEDNIYSHIGGMAIDNEGIMDLDEIFHCSNDDDDYSTYNSAGEESKNDNDEAGVVAYDEQNVENQMEMAKSMQSRETRMIDCDIGSLAQSLSSSHLGASPNLRVQMTSSLAYKTPAPTPRHPKQVVLKLGSASSNVDGLRRNGLSDHGGGIGSLFSDEIHDNNTNSKETKCLQQKQHRQQQPEQMQSSEGFPQTNSQTFEPSLDLFGVKKVLGTGSFGKVFLVEENKTKQSYALKVLCKKYISHKGQLERTKAEQRILEQVKHPFIVGMHMAFQSVDKLYLVLDFCAGGDLFYLLHRFSRLPEKLAMFYTAEIVIAVSWLHSLHIVYRDLKPENVLLDGKGHIRLTDFGLAKEGITSPLSGTKSVVGTPDYVAPEVRYNDKKGYGTAVDWWSLGSLLYELLQGIPPFYKRARSYAVKYNPEIFSHEAKALIESLLIVDPAQRLGSGPNGAKDIKFHGFFGHHIEWDKLEWVGTEAPYKPHINGSVDTSHFDKQFTSMQVFNRGGSLDASLDTKEFREWSSEQCQSLENT